MLAVTIVFNTAILCQLGLLVFHQATTLFDFYPFNGARNYTRQEKLAEAGVNAVLMSLGPLGFALRVKGLMVFGMVYYFVLFAMELIIWWIPYFITPIGRWRRLYNGLLAVATSHFDPGDTLDAWVATYDRLHRGTLGWLPDRKGRPVPNVEHTLLHAWTLVTALVTVIEWMRPLK